MSTVIVRNGAKLCAKCRDKGCERVIGGTIQTDDEHEHVSEEPCSCCQSDFPVLDDLGF